MENQFVSEPMDFNYKEGNAVDFAKTFDLSGNDNDQMLKMYLRKAGLSDNIEYLTVEQRRAFIYDIVKSNKHPGYWKPSVLPQMRSPTVVPFNNPPPTFNYPPPPVERFSSITLDCIDDIPPASMTFDFATYSQAKGSAVPSNAVQANQSVEQKTTGRSTLYERQFRPQISISSNKSLSTPPSTPPPVTTLVTRKGRKINVSGPMNFQHVSGDMTRDMTKNAFDLSGQFNDNSLKKYMIERGITEEDVRGLDNKDLIRRIVQSKYTWMPKRKVVGSVYVPPPPSTTYVAPTPVPTPPERVLNHSKGGALIIEPPVVPPMGSSPNENIYEEIVHRKPVRTSTRRHRKQLPPPPPVPVAALNTSKNYLKEPIQKQPLIIHNKPPPELKADKAFKGIPVPPPPPPMPPPMPVEKMSGNMVEEKAVPLPPPPPPPAPPMSVEKSIEIPVPPPIKIGKATVGTGISGGVPPPPPPPPLAKHPPLPSEIELKSNTQAKPVEGGGDPRDAFLESIRTGVALKKVVRKEKVRKGLGAPIETKQPDPIAATSDDVKQAPFKSEKPDFMSELRNATLKRIKKLENNPYASESTC